MPKNPLTQDASDKITQIAAVADMMPGVILINDLRDWSIAWMSPRGLKLLGASLEEITCMNHKDYFLKYFNKEDDFIPKVLDLLQRNNSEDICTYFHQIRFKINGDWEWYMGSVKILTRDEEGKPLLVISIALPIDSMHHMTVKAGRLLAENNFLRKNSQQFAKLSERERDVLRLMALGKSSADSAEELFISQNTVETHRKNIRQKLDTSSYYELGEYARAFDLI